MGPTLSSGAARSALDREPCNTGGGEREQGLKGDGAHVGRKGGVLGTEAEQSRGIRARWWQQAALFPGTAPSPMPRSSPPLALLSGCACPSACWHRAFRARGRTRDKREDS